MLLRTPPPPLLFPFRISPLLFSSLSAKSMTLLFGLKIKKNFFLLISLFVMDWVSSFFSSFFLSSFFLPPFFPSSFFPSSLPSSFFSSPFLLLPFFLLPFLLPSSFFSCFLLLPFSFRLPSSLPPSSLLLLRFFPSFFLLPFCFLLLPFLLLLFLPLLPLPPSFFLLFSFSFFFFFPFSFPFLSFVPLLLPFLFPSPSFLPFFSLLPFSSFSPSLFSFSPPNLLPPSSLLSSLLSLRLFPPFPFSLDCSPFPLFLYVCRSKMNNKGRRIEERGIASVKELKWIFEWIAGDSDYSLPVAKALVASLQNRYIYPLLLLSSYSPFPSLPSPLPMLMPYDDTNDF